MALNNNGRWPYRVEVGDVIKDRNGTCRVVRYVKQDSKSGFTVYVGLAIKRCSWTNRCYTIISCHDLAYRGFVPTGMRANLKLRQIDRQIAECLEIKNILPHRQLLCANDVIGVVA